MAKNKSKIMQRRAHKKAQHAVARKRSKTRSEGLLSAAWAAQYGCTRGAVKQAPIDAAYVGQVIFTQGIGDVLVTRRLPDGRIAYGMFLIDAWCLGVKDAFLRIESQARFDVIFQKSDEFFDFKAVEPACAHKLIVDAIAYARDLGFKPHTDYHAAALILDGIDPADCTETFRFGDNGKPHFLAGPHDSESMRRRVIAQLQARCGPDGANVTIPIADASGAPASLISRAPALEAFSSSEIEDADEEESRGR